MIVFQTTHNHISVSFVVLHAVACVPRLRWRYMLLFFWAWPDCGNRVAHLALCSQASAVKRSARISPSSDQEHRSRRAEQWIFATRPSIFQRRRTCSLTCSTTSRIVALLGALTTRGSAPAPTRSRALITWLSRCRPTDQRPPQYVCG